jgi:esterase/lipase superfamily enzyme
MDLKNKVILITNRNVNPEQTDTSLFGDDLNTISEAELNIATAQYKNKRWELDLLSDPVNPDYDTPVSRQVFKEIIKQARTDPKAKDWVFFIHGFNQSLTKNLNKCRELQKYGVNVAAFSWPSNPGPQKLWKKKKEYKKARKNARRSVLAVERTMEKFASYMEEFSNENCPINVTLVVHSLGNYVFENYVNSPDFSRETRFFSNVMLHQSDIDHRHHKAWTEKLSDHVRVYVTINENDLVLDTSDIVNPDRLGNTAKDLDSNSVTYMDFTWGLDVGTSHRPWQDPGKKNQAVHKFYNLVFHSRRGEKAHGWQLNTAKNAYELIEQEDF